MAPSTTAFCPVLMLVLVSALDESLESFGDPTETQRKTQSHPWSVLFRSDKKNKLLGADEIGNTSNILHLNQSHLVSLDE